MFMFRELAVLQNREEMATETGLTVSMGLEGRTEMDIGKGWVEHVRPDGKRFYVNNTTGKRTWQRPEEEGVLKVTEFDRCEGMVSKMKYEGRFPKEMEMRVADAGDCTAFLERLYSANETRWSRESAAAAGVDTSAAGAMPHSHSAAAAAPLLKPEDTYIPRAAATNAA